MAFTLSVAEVIAADTSGLLSKHESWERVPLAEIASILNGAPFDSALFNSNEGMPLVRIRDVLSGQTSTYYTGSYEDAYVVESGDLLIGMDGDFNCGYWKAQRSVLNQRVCKITPNEFFYDKRLLAYALPGYLAAINANTPSVTVKHLSSKTIGEIDLPLPPRSEQTRIVEKLDELFSDLDASVTELKAAQKKLVKYRQSLLKAAVEGALTAEWRKTHQPEESGAQVLERILKQRRTNWEVKQLAKFQQQGKTPPKGWQDKYPEPVKPDTSDLPELPEGWVWATVDQLASMGTGVTPLKSKSQYYLNGDIPWVTSGALNDEMVVEASEYVTPLALTECRLELYPAGTLLVAMYGEGKTRGKCSELAIPATINQAIAALVLNGSALACKSYLKSFLLKSYDDMRNQASGGVQPNLNLQIIRSVAIPLPPLDEQRVITDTLFKQIESAKYQGSAIDLSLKQSSAQRHNILKAAFSGKLVPQDHNDEPASVLLERIRTERATQEVASKTRKAKIKNDIEITMNKLIDVLAEAGDWMNAQDVFRRYGVADGSKTDQIEVFYSELRELDKAKRLLVEPVTDADGRKLYDRIKLLNTD